MLFSVFFFFFNDTATTEIYTLSLHDALPISDDVGPRLGNLVDLIHRRPEVGGLGLRHRLHDDRGSAANRNAADDDLSRGSHVEPFYGGPPDPDQPCCEQLARCVRLRLARGRARRSSDLVGCAAGGECGESRWTTASTSPATSPTACAPT